MTLIDPRVTRMAEVLVDHCTKIQKGDLVFIHHSWDSRPLLYEVYRLALLRGAREVVLKSDFYERELLEIFLKNTTSEQRATTPSVYEYAVHHADVYMMLSAPANTRYAANIDPDSMNEFMQTLRPITTHRVENTRWVVAQFPSNALAMDAEMSLSDYEDFLFSAVNDVDWAAKAVEQEKLKEIFAQAKTVRIVGADTDLTLSVEGRPPASAAGKVNMPDGEVFNSVVEDSAQGRIRFTFPAIYAGKEFTDVALEFVDGLVVKATASKNEEGLNKILDMDAGARRLGEIGLGNNYAIKQFTKNILFDEKIGGTLHMAVGAGYPETGSKNQSAIHWDFICDMRDDSEITVDGDLFYKNGQFMLD
jgi:aminopeptidase